MFEKALGCEAGGGRGTQGGEAPSTDLLQSHTLLFVPLFFFLNYLTLFHCLIFF